MNGFMVIAVTMGEKVETGLYASLAEAVEHIDDIPPFAEDGFRTNGERMNTRIIEFRDGVPIGEVGCKDHENGGDVRVLSHAEWIDWPER